MRHPCLVRIFDVSEGYLVFMVVPFMTKRRGSKDDCDGERGLHSVGGGEYSSSDLEIISRVIPQEIASCNDTMTA